MSAPACGTCRYCNHAPAVAVAGVAPHDECRRYPPQVVAIPVNVPGRGGAFAPVASFPAVTKETWCGEYAPVVANG